MRQKSRRVIRFVLFQFIALIGWIAIQSFFSLSPVGQTLPFMVIIFIEAVWWSGLLLILLLLLLGEYNRFVQAAVDLEDANRRLRLETNRLVPSMRNEPVREESRASIAHTQEESVAVQEQDTAEEA